MFHLDLPEDLVKAVEGAQDGKARVEVGIEWLVAQSQELKKRGVPCLHYYTMGDASIIRRVAEQVF